MTTAGPKYVTRFKWLLAYSRHIPTEISVRVCVFLSGRCLRALSHNQPPPSRPAPSGQAMGKCPMPFFRPASSVRYRHIYLEYRIRRWLYVLVHIFIHFDVYLYLYFFRIYFLMMMFYFDVRTRFQRSLYGRLFDVVLAAASVFVQQIGHSSLVATGHEL